MPSVAIICIANGGATSTYHTVFRSLLLAQTLRESFYFLIACRVAAISLFVHLRPLTQAGSLRWTARSAFRHWHRSQSRSTSHSNFWNVPFWGVGKNPQNLSWCDVCAQTLLCS